MAGVGQHRRDALAQCWHAGGAAGEEHAVDSCRVHIGRTEQFGDAAAHALQQRADGAFEQLATQLGDQAGFDARQVDIAALAVGQLDLAGFHLHRQPVAGALLDELEQAIDAGGVDDVVAHVLQRQLGLLRVHRVDGVPGGEVEVIAGWHEGVALHLAAVAEQRHHALDAQLLVEVGTADVHAAGGEDVALAVGHCAALRRQANQREVRGAAADVDDQHQFFTLDAALVVEGCGEWFVLEGNVLETEFLRHGHQGVLGFLVGLGIIVDEKHRAAQHHGLELAPGDSFGALLQLADEQPEQVLERHGAAQHGGFALQQRGAQQAFQRAHEAAFVAFQVLVQGQAAVHRTAFLDVEEDHRGQGDLVVFQGDQRFGVRAPPADGGVGSAEVDAQGAGRSGREHGARVSGEKTAAQFTRVFAEIQGIRRKTMVAKRAWGVACSFATLCSCSFPTRVFHYLISVLPPRISSWIPPCTEPPSTNCARISAPY